MLARGRCVAADASTWCCRWPYTSRPHVGRARPGPLPVTWSRFIHICCMRPFLCQRRIGLLSLHSKRVWVLFPVRVNFDLIFRASWKNPHWWDYFTCVTRFEDSSHKLTRSSRLRGRHRSIETTFGSWHSGEVMVVEERQRYHPEVFTAITMTY